MYAQYIYMYIAKTILKLHKIPHAKKSAFAR